MRGEHTVGEKRLTWAPGTRPRSELDEVSSKILKGGRKPGKLGQDLMRGEHTVGASRKDADQRSNLNNAPKEPEWATGTGTENMAAGTSIFDPVLCELAYRWFCPPAGTILDPFAGGSVRGIVASRLGRKYIGIDLSAQQIEANRAQGTAICTKPMPEWIEGDSVKLAKLLPAKTMADFIFSCPPYADLERYSDHPRDLSGMKYPVFLRSYRAVIAAALKRLKPDRFACFVVGDIRDDKGFYRNFVADTIQAFQDAGAMLYNEAILVTAIGSLPIRVGRQFEMGRKLGKTHQNVLVFLKGDSKKATAAIGPVEFGSIEDDSAGLLNGNPTGPGSTADRVETAEG